MLCIIPARGGSKRIPRKNIKIFKGKPIIEYPLEVAKKSGLFEKIIISTDDPEIAEKYKDYVPFMRSAENANDTAGVAEVALEVLGRLSSQGEYYYHFCMLFPTAVFVKEHDLIVGCGLMTNGGYDSVFSVSRYTHPIERAMRIDGLSMAMVSPENYTKRTQDLPVSYYDAGQFYFVDVESLSKQKRFFMGKSMGIEIKNVVDIDNEEDWARAERLYDL